MPALPCCLCGALERAPLVVFGEILPEAKVSTLIAELSRGFDMIISIGTSGSATSD
ncbi:MAG TPA: Sir2 family NAD-dependent protein deacetylase [Polyangiaceae bacterium]|nr:Sir2 family NAD-dependent protein deacetylase [Polyangiaceae bacterium]